MKSSNFENIDLVIVNFYPFEKTISETKNHSKIVENIYVGGPTMVRAAAKNYNDVTIITKLDQYENLIVELNKNNGSTSLPFRQKMSEVAFTETASYDAMISHYFGIFEAMYHWEENDSRSRNMSLIKTQPKL